MPIVRSNPRPMLIVDNIIEINGENCCIISNNGMLLKESELDLMIKKIETTILFYKKHNVNDESVSESNVAYSQFLLKDNVKHKS